MCDLLCTARARTGDLAGAVDAVRRRIQLRPLEEAGYRTLMLLQADLGDRAGAVSTYHHCASVLERELGVIPDPATQQAFQRLMADRDPAGANLPGLQPDAPRSGIATAQLVGRRRELGLLQDLWRAAAAGRPGLALVGGGAGVGKTRLVAEIAEMARLQGAVVASSQCFGTSGRLALAPVADWLRNPAVQAAAAALDPPWRTEVRRLVPAGGRGERSAGSRSMADAWQRHRFFEGLARALMAAGRPVLLVLDNMQWCDQETLAFLTFFLGLAPGTPVLVAGTLRNDTLDEDPELADWTVRMRATGLHDGAFPEPAGRRRHGTAGRGDLRTAPACGRREPAPGDDGRLPALRHRGGTRQCRSRRHSAAGRRSHGSAAQPPRPGDRGRPGGGRPGGGGGDELHP